MSMVNDDININIRDIENRIFLVNFKMNSYNNDLDLFAGNGKNKHTIVRSV